MGVYGLHEGFFAKKSYDNLAKKSYESKYGKVKFSKEELSRINKAKDIVSKNLKSIEKDYDSCYGKNNEKDNPIRKKILNACVLEYNKRLKEKKLEDDDIESYGKDKTTPIDMQLHLSSGYDNNLNVDMFDNIDVSNFLNSTIKSIISDACKSDEIDRLGVNTKVIVDQDSDGDYEFMVLFSIKKK